jgi:hypothetical protein
MSLKSNTAYYWRFIGEKVYRYGYATMVSNGLYRMGHWNGDDSHGPIVDENEIEARALCSELV